MALAAAHRKAKGMEIIGTVLAPRKLCKPCSSSRESVASPGNQRLQIYRQSAAASALI
jgi:hypothetical protein